jgi:dihydrofolate reductase
MHLSLIVAVADNGVIGARGGIPWHIPEDVRRFKALTMGKPVIMGRRTWESLPRRPLRGRQNIVISRNEHYSAPGARVVRDFESALFAAADVEEAFVLGGTAIFALALPQADRIYLTEVHASPEGDTYFPTFDRSLWRETLHEDHPADGERPAYSFVDLERAPHP